MSRQNGQTDSRNSPVARPILLDMENGNPVVDLGDPSTWCDACCKLCPRLDRCQAGQSVARRRRVHQIRGEEPDDPRVVIDDICGDLEKALELLAEVAEREGIDVSGPTFDPPSSPALEEASRLGIELVMAAKALADAALDGGAREEDEALAFLVGGSGLLASKTTRLVWEDVYEPYERCRSWSPPSSAILLLIEHVAERLDRAAAHLGDFVTPAVRARFDTITRQHRKPLATVAGERFSGHARSDSRIGEWWLRPLALLSSRRHRSHAGCWFSSLIARVQGDVTGFQSSSPPASPRAPASGPGPWPARRRACSR